jgi:hypothetical protein
VISPADPEDGTSGPPLGAASHHQTNPHDRDQVNTNLNREDRHLAKVLCAAAVEYAEHHWKVFPLRGKAPAIPRAHPRFFLVATSACVEGLATVPNPLRDCRGGCGQFGHGLYDATYDVDTVTGWWTGPYAWANIGARIPESMLMIDIDPRHGGLDSWAGLMRRYGAFPTCLMTISGRGDGGCHLYVRRPPAILSPRRLGPGIDLKTSTGYAVTAPSIHPDTGVPYTLVDGPVPAPPEWFIELVTEHRLPHTGSTPRLPSSHSPADAYSAAVSWADVLEPQGWECLDYDPDADGARWLHPNHTSRCSATIRHGCLFVWSTNTAFAVTEPGYPRGYTKFRAYAVLNHKGDMSAAARAIRREAR